jgi:periplasmic protein TonB
LISLPAHILYKSFAIIICIIYNGDAIPSKFHTTLFLWKLVQRSVLAEKTKTMEANKILKADLLDIIFEHRNKAYGAYELRSTYAARIKRSMIGMGAVCLVFITGVLLANSAKKNADVKMFVKDIELTNYVEDEKKEPVIVEPPKAKPVEVRTIAVTIPKIVPDDQLEHTEVPPEEAIENVQIAAVTKEGINSGDVINPPAEEGTGNTISLKPKEEDYENGVVIRVQIEAQYHGGIKEWSKFLERTLNTEIPIENGAPAGRYTVLVSFLVDKEGNVSEIQALNDPGYGTAAEAIKVIKKSKQWIPAIQNGRNVTYRQKQSITFVVNEG